jgi:hypothetical protein
MDNGRKLQIVGRIIFFMSLELTRGIGYHLAFLHKNTNETDVRGIAIDIKVLVNIRLSENGSGSETIFESLEGFLTSLGPFELDPILQQLGHRLGNFRKILYEPAVVSRKSKKTPDIGDTSRLFPFKNILHFARIDGNAILRENMTKKGYFFKPKLTLAKLGIKTMLPKLL